MKKSIGTCIVLTFLTVFSTFTEATEITDPTADEMYQYIIKSLQERDRTHESIRESIENLKKLTAILIEVNNNLRVNVPEALGMIRGRGRTAEDNRKLDLSLDEKDWFTARLMNGLDGELQDINRALNSHTIGMELTDESFNFIGSIIIDLGRVSYFQILLSDLNAKTRLLYIGSVFGEMEETINGLNQSINKDLSE